MERSPPIGRAQLLAVAADFIALFASASLIEELKRAAPDEAKINKIIEDKQSAIFSKHGMNFLFVGRG